MPDQSYVLLSSPNMENTSEQGTDTGNIDNKVNNKIDTMPLSLNGTSSLDIAELKELASTNVSNAFGNAVNDNINTLTSVVTAGLSGQTQPIYVSAGSNDKIRHYNIWINSFGNLVKQKPYNTVKGYKTNTSGVFVGIDTCLHNKITVGIAGSYSTFNTKYSNYANLNKTVTNAYLLSLYSKYHFNNKLFVQGVASLGHYVSKNKNIKSIILAKPKSKSYSGHLLLGCNNYLSKKVILTPGLGVNYTHLNIKSYKSLGPNGTNITIGNKKQDIVEGVIGASIKYWNDKIIPEIYGFVHHSLCNKSSDTKIQIGNLLGANNTIKSEGPHKTFYQLGTKIVIESNKGKVQYGISYDCYLAKKYISHSGAINLKAKF